MQGTYTISSRGPFKIQTLVASASAGTAGFPHPCMPGARDGCSGGGGLIGFGVSSSIWIAMALGHRTSLMNQSTLHSQTQGLIFGWCCVEPGVGLPAEREGTALCRSAGAHSEQLEAARSALRSCGQQRALLRGARGAGPEVPLLCSQGSAHGGVSRAVPLPSPPVPSCSGVTLRQQRPGSSTGSAVRALAR